MVGKERNLLKDSVLPFPSTYLLVTVNSGQEKACLGDLLGKADLLVGRHSSFGLAGTVRLKQLLAPWHSPFKQAAQVSLRQVGWCGEGSQH